MGFLAPWFLLGLAGVAAPLYLHLLRRQTTNPRQFSSLMFFEPRTQASMRHRKLRYLWLLVLRLALLALLVFAFADPFILRPAASVTGDRLTVLVIDHSFSMQAGTRLADAQRQAAATLVGLTGKVQVMALGNRLEVLTQPSTDRAALRAAIAGIEPGWSHADFGELARGLKASVAASGTPVTVQFFSDMQMSGMPASFADLMLPGNTTLVTHNVVGATAPPNWTVASIQAPTELWGSPKDTPPARVEAVVRGYNTPAASIPVVLEVNGHVVARQTVQVPASGSATADFDSVTFGYGWSEATVRVEPAADLNDGFAADNSGVFSVRRADPQHVLFVHAASDARSPLYFGAALQASAGSAFVLDAVSEGGVVGRQPSQYALVVLADATALPAEFASELRQYVETGGGLLIAAGTATRALPVFGGTVAQPEDYGEQYLAVGDSDTAYPATALLGNWPGVKFYYAARIVPGDARVIARLSDGTPLLLDRKVGEGRVVVFASGFDNLTNDFPLHAAFVPFVREMASYLAGNQEAGPQAVDSYLTLRTAKEQGAAAAIAVQVTDPQGRRPLSLAQALTAQTLPLSEAGFYQLKLADGRQQVVAVNPDRRESDLSPIPEETLALWRGTPGNGSPLAGSTAAAAGAAPSRVPVSLWWYILLLMLVAAATESFVAARYLKVRRDEEPAGEPLQAAGVARGVVGRGVAGR
jgi:hypothetical protein